MQKAITSVAGTIGVVVVIALVRFLVFGGGGEEDDWAQQFIEITNEETQASLPVQRTINDALLCSTEVECSEAYSALQQSLIPYMQVVDKALFELSSIDPPSARAREMQSATDKLLRNEKRWAETLLECARTLDDATCLEADSLYETSIRMTADVLDALEPFLEE